MNEGEKPNVLRGTLALKPGQVFIADKDAKFVAADGERPVVKLADGVYEADAGETVDALFEFMEYEDPEENEDFVNMPISEWVLSALQAVPREQDSFRYHHLEITVSAMDHNRILKVRVGVSAEDQTEAGAAADEPQPSETEGRPSEEGGDA